MATTPTSAKREVFTGRSAFIFAAVGSAVGLGNIWRFPYVAYENGGGAFIIPYLVALVTAGIPLLFLDYVLGHRYRASPPLALRSMSRFTEPLGWLMVLIPFVIAIYYAAIIGWAMSYFVFSFTTAWGSDPEAFLFGDYLQFNGEYTLTSPFVPGVLIPMVIVWVVTLAVLLLGVQNGIGRFNMIFIPLLVVVFLGLCVRSLTLEGAMVGLDAFFRPDFEALSNPSVWVAAYGQIFFSLSVMLGAMLTYASYLKRRTNLTGSGLVVGFSNSAFEILAGITVFGALGFMAVQAGVNVDEVAAGGIGMAFIAFPTLINEMAGGPIFGALFFGSLVFAGLTSLISLAQVPIATIRDKTGMGDRTSTLVVGGLMALASCATMPTMAGLNLLDVVDAFVNTVGIVGIALLACILVAWVARKLPLLRDHLNAVSSFKLGWYWMACVGFITPVVLGYMFFSGTSKLVTDGYGDMPSWYVGAFGWGTIGALIVAALILSLTPWPQRSIDRVRDAQARFEAEAGPAIPAAGQRDLGTQEHPTQHDARATDTGATRTDAQEGGRP
ncbi:MAG: sodium-dependent transporter [Mobilicoccus sp.]|nr:sodium-dependent transporter [Mobilicoccus sp.]